MTRSRLRSAGKALSQVPPEPPKDPENPYQTREKPIGDGSMNLPEGSSFACVGVTTVGALTQLRALRNGEQIFVTDNGNCAYASVIRAFRLVRTEMDSFYDPGESSSLLPLQPQETNVRVSVQWADQFRSDLAEYYRHLWVLYHPHGQAAARVRSWVRIGSILTAGRTYAEDVAMAAIGTALGIDIRIDTILGDERGNAISSALAVLMEKTTKPPVRVELKNLHYWPEVNLTHPLLVTGADASGEGEPTCLVRKLQAWSAFRQKIGDAAWMARRQWFWSEVYAATKPMFYHDFQPDFRQVWDFADYFPGLDAASIPFSVPDAWRSTHEMRNAMFATKVWQLNNAPSLNCRGLLPESDDWGESAHAAYLVQLRKGRPVPEPKLDQQPKQETHRTVPPEQDGSEDRSARTDGERRHTIKHKPKKPRTFEEDQGSDPDDSSSSSSSSDTSSQTSSSDHDDESSTSTGTNSTRISRKAGAKKKRSRKQERSINVQSLYAGATVPQPKLEGYDPSTVGKFRRAWEEYRNLGGQGELVGSISASLREIIVRELQRRRPYWNINTVDDFVKFLRKESSVTKLVEVFGASPDMITADQLDFAPIWPCPALSGNIRDPVGFFEWYVAIHDAMHVRDIGPRQRAHTLVASLRLHHTTLHKKLAPLLTARTDSKDWHKIAATVGDEMNAYFHKWSTFQQRFGNVIFQKQSQIAKEMRDGRSRLQDVLDGKPVALSSSQESTSVAVLDALGDTRAVVASSLRTKSQKRRYRRNRSSDRKDNSSRQGDVERSKGHSRPAKPASSTVVAATTSGSPTSL